MKKLIVILGLLSFPFSTKTGAAIKHTFYQETVSYVRTTNKDTICYPYKFHAVTNVLTLAFHNSGHTLYKKNEFNLSKNEQYAVTQHLSDKLFNSENPIELTLYECDGGKFATSLLSSSNSAARRFTLPCQLQPGQTSMMNIYNLNGQRIGAKLLIRSGVILKSLFRNIYTNTTPFQTNLL